ncbi:tyrosine-type recombinase/integrase [Streptomyces sp. GZWMJZ-114]|uniref:tyrosine-type recombinase/integrase n=1 Tax=Streptomyces sp. GZWMJZ-114 TaxID=2494734 RepID=UPI0013E92262|nr:tyrosine-type recombinase/integrase [Streptomyces sp. GZWMJZ-114]
MGYITSEAIEEERLYSVEQVRALLKWVKENSEVAPSAYPFLLVIAEHALRPVEAMNIRVGEVELPARGPGKMLVRHREKERNLPIAPEIVSLLRKWTRDAGLREGDYLFPGRRGGQLRTATYRPLWEQAQTAVLSQGNLRSGRLGERVDILRDSIIVDWLRSGISCFEVAARAGVAPVWLARRYPYCFRVEEDKIDWHHLYKVMAIRN